MTEKWGKKSKSKKKRHGVKANRETRNIPVCELKVVNHALRSLQEEDSNSLSQ